MCHKMKRIRFILTYIIKVKFTTVFFLLTLISLIESNSQVTFQKTFFAEFSGSANRGWDRSVTN